ncbi:NADPH:quinone reductase [Sinomonas cellulolyticus]|uniref:NADPH:quinone reductase n=1 Tax=Sinomonas cellulolyticus TaxID=2801916 RepID=A0ABS1JY36_9MICC|nr:MULTISPECIES: NADPH:quinone reductase [Sinomonas]MBL0703927.1 NADPH:quinone reductase [Sinomonas cellulolyticus]GHG57679.1 NADPH:quinone reductase [Sinomonas sp. KCTC 49339]
MAETYRAVQYNQTGPSSVLTLHERELAEPGEGQVRIRIAVAGVNPTDWKARAGGTYPGALDGWHMPGQDAAGTVDAVGPGAEGLEPGQRVWLWDVAYGGTEGTAQEYAIVPAEKVQPLPDGESFETGASLGIPALTAHRALTASEHGPARLAPGSLAGRTVLVTGGAGAVGHAAIQLARWAGAQVVATVSSGEKAALASAAGASAVVNYREQEVAAEVRRIAPGGADVIVDVNVAANIRADLDAVALGGTISVYAGTGDETVSVPVRPAMGKNARLQFLLTYTVTDAQKHDAVAAVGAALADGALRVGEGHGLPLTRFPLAETAAAHDAVEAGFVGKVLIDVAD